MRNAIARALLPRRPVLLGVALALPLWAGAEPAQAQDVFGFLRMLSAPAIRAPVHPSYHYRAVPDFELGPLRRSRPRVRAEPSPKPPIKPKPMGEVANPVPELLGDPTLRRGDIVMFPSGPRVFTGGHGSRHGLGDFEPLHASDRSLAPSTRKLAATLRPGVNTAWSTDNLGSRGKLAETVNDVATTGSIARARR